MSLVRPQVLLVGVVAEVAAALHAALADGADLVQVSAEEVLAHSATPAPNRGPTLVVIGRELPAPLGLAHALRPNGIDLAVIVVSTPVTQVELAPLPLLLTGEQACQVPAARADQLPAIARQLLEAMARRRHYTAVRAAAQRQLGVGTAISRQLGEQLFGEFLTQAPIGAIMLDDTGGILAWNHKATDILGLTEPDSLGRALAGLFPSPTRTRLHQDLAHPTNIDAVFDRTGRDGAAQSLRLAFQQVSDAQGVDRLLVLVEDVTDRVQTQRLLAERTSHALLSADVAAAMTAGGALPQKLHKAAEAIVDRLDAALARVWIIEPVGNVLNLRASAGMYTHLDGEHAHIPVGALKIGLIAAERRPHLTNSVIGDPQVNDQEWARREGMVAFAGYPLITDGELMGVLGLFARHPLPDAALDALAGIANQIAVGVREDRLLQQLSSTAETLQRSLLPAALPNVPRLALAARYLPGAEGVEAGGDW
ncbi:MAG: GAF domain-containing protein, partial [Pseudonocardiaceae bacterium]